jgi:hypothetical protein
MFYSKIICAALGVIGIAHRDRKLFESGAKQIFKFASDARLYRILHYKKPAFYRPKLGKNKRRVLAFKRRKFVNAVSW